MQSFDKKALKLNLDTNKTRSKIGVEISNKDITKILKSLEFEVSEKSADKFEVTVPTHRSSKDVTTADDLIEEVVRMYGYDNIDPELPSLPTKLPQENNERFKKHRVRDLFAYALGFDEVSNYSFYGQAELDRCKMSEDGHLKVLNFLSEDQTHMRTSLVPNLLKSIEKNVKNFESFQIFEIGRTYKDIDQFMPLEEKYVGGAVVGTSDEVFYEAKGAVEALFEKFGIKPPKTVTEVEGAPYAHPRKAISYLQKNGDTLAKVFILHPAVQKNHELKGAHIALFEVNFSELIQLEKREYKYQPIPKFPSTDFDISILMERDKEVGPLQSKIKNADPLIISTELFDIYQGEHVGESEKAVAFKVTLRADDRTLNEEEINSAQQKVFKIVEKEGGQIRGK